MITYRLSAVVLLLATVCSVNSKVPNLAPGRYRVSEVSADLEEMETVFEFSDDRVTYTECNNYFCSFSQNGKKIKIGPCGGTKMACQFDTFEGYLDQALGEFDQLTVQG